MLRPILFAVVMLTAILALGGCTSRPPLAPVAGAGVAIEASATVVDRT